MGCVMATEMATVATVTLLQWTEQIQEPNVENHCILLAHRWEFLTVPLEAGKFVCIT